MKLKNKPAKIDKKRVSTILDLHKQGKLPHHIAVKMIMEMFVEVSHQGSFMRAQGLIPWQDGDELPEDVIRRHRDAE